MKRIFVIVLAIMMVAGMAYAEDRLQLTGQMRVRAWDTSGKSVNWDLDADGMPTDATTVDDVDQSYFDQRFRVGAEINVADGVKGVLRFDFAEDAWGSPDWEGSRYGSGTELQVDRAYLDVTKGIVNVRAGQQLLPLGNYIAADGNQTGLLLTLKMPVTLNLAYIKLDERDSYEDEEDDGTADLDAYAAQLTYAQDNFAVQAFYATVKDGNDDGLEPNVIGFTGKVNVGIVTIKGELDIFGGEIGKNVLGTADDIDVMGTQFWGNAEAAVMDNLKVGVDLIYSDGNDSDGDEIKLTYLSDWGDWVISDRGPFNTDITPLGGADAMDPDIFGAASSYLEARMGGAVPNVGGQGGAIGGGVYATFTAMEGLDLTAQVMYLSADEDSDTWFYDDATIFNIGADYMFAPNSHLMMQYSKTDWSTEIDDLDDSYDVIVAQISIDY